MKIKLPIAMTPWWKNYTAHYNTYAGTKSFFDTLLREYNVRIRGLDDGWYLSGDEKDVFNFVMRWS